MNPIMKVISKVHTVLLQISGGRIGNTVGGTDILLLNHVGAKSGKRYATPLAFVKEGNGYAVVAGAAGADKHPGWYYNLQANPETTIAIRGETIPVTAEIAPQATRERIWADVAARYPQYNKFQSMTTRVIPVMLLHRQTSK